MDKESSTIRIVDIARMAGVSAGTVDRVIHNRGRVSEENRKKIKAVLEKVNYQPNLMARSLASKKTHHIVAVIPSYQKGAYWEAVAEGIDKAAIELQPFNVSVSKLYFDQYNNDSFDTAICNLPNEEIDGVLIATLFADSVIGLSCRLDEKEVPYVYVDSDIPGEGQLAYYGTESYDAGKIAAKLLMNELKPQSDVLIARIASRWKNDSTQGKKREKGFYDYWNEHNNGGRIYEVELKIEDAKYNELKLDEVFDTYHQLNGGIIFNSSCYLLGDYLREKNRTYVKLVGYDLIERNTQLLTEGVITALIAQRPEQQGYNAIKALGNFCVLSQKPEKVNLMPIDILIRENICHYVNYKL